MKNNIRFNIINFFSYIFFISNIRFNIQNMYIKKSNILKKNLIYIQDNFFKFIKIKNIMSKKTWLIWTIKLLFGLVILFILFYKVGIYNILNTIKSINPIYLLPLIITFLSDSLLATLNIKILLKAINLKLI